MNIHDIEPSILPANLDPDAVRALHTVLLNLVDHLESVYFAQLHETDETPPDHATVNHHRACPLPGDEPPF